MILLQKAEKFRILTELSAQMDELNYVVVGLGINVNVKEFPKT